MKRIITSLILITSVLTLCVSCARKSFPAFTIKKESVTQIEFKQAKMNPEDIGNPECVKKTVTEDSDIESIIDWAHSLKLEAHEPIEYPIQDVRYIIVLKGKLEHRITFLDNYVLFDAGAFTYKSDSQKDEVSQKYNLLNYEPTETTLGYTN